MPVADCCLRLVSLPTDELESGTPNSASLLLQILGTAREGICSKAQRGSAAQQQSQLCSQCLVPSCCLAGKAAPQHSTGAPAWNPGQSGAIPGSLRLIPCETTVMEMHALHARRESSLCAGAGPGSRGYAQHTQDASRHPASLRQPAHAQSAARQPAPLRAATVRAQLLCCSCTCPTGTKG